MHFSKIRHLTGVLIQRAGGVSDQLPMKQKKGSKRVSNYPFPFHEKKIVKLKFDGAYSDKIQIAVSGTNHTVTTADNRVLHRKHISKPISEITQEPNNRGTGLRGPDGRFINSPRTFTIHYSDSESEDSEPDTTTPKKTGTVGRGRPKLIRNRQSSESPGGHNKLASHKQPSDR